MGVPLPDGIITALVTPFKGDLSVDHDALGRLVEAQVAAGVAGVCALGGTGEPMSLTQEERRQAVSTVVEAAGGRVHVVAGAIVGNVDEVLDLATHSERVGADSIMVMPPVFVMPKPAHVKRYFQDIAEATSLPLVLFNAQVRAGINLSAAFMAELIADVPSLKAVKESSGNMSQVAELIATISPAIKVYQGWEDLLLPTTGIGGSGGFHTLGNLLPGDYVRIHKRAVSGDVAGARAVHEPLISLLGPAYAEPNPGPTKHAMQLLGIPGGGPTRRPLYPVAEATKAAFRTWLDGYGRTAKAA